MEQMQLFIDNFVKMCDYNSHVKNLITMGRLLAVERFLEKEEIDYFADYFLELVKKMMEDISDQDELSHSWEYLDDFYRSMIVYLEDKEYYEMASNFYQFLLTYNGLIQQKNEETINAE